MKLIFRAILIRSYYRQIKVLNTITQSCAKFQQKNVRVPCIEGIGWKLVTVMGIEPRLIKAYCESPLDHLLLRCV